MCWKQEEKTVCEILNKFGKTQIVMARRIGQSICKTAGLWSVPGITCSDQYLSQVVHYADGQVNVLYLAYLGKR